MRILVVEFAPAGGLFHFALQLGDALVARGHDVELLTGPNPELSSRQRGLRIAPALPTWRPGGKAHDSQLRRVLRRSARGVRYVEAWRRVIARTRAERPDVVQLGDLRFGIDGRFVDRLTKLPSPPVVVDLAHTPRPHSRRRGDSSLHRRDHRTLSGLARAYGNLDAAVVLGESSREELLDSWPQVRRAEVVPHGRDGIFGRPVPTPDSAGPEILFFGNLDRYKGLDVLLDAFARLRSRGVEAHLMIAGALSANVDLDELTARAAAIGGIELRIGYVPIDDVAPLFARARVVALPYLAANQSGVAHVAQSFGRPIVATAVGDLANVVRDGETGLLVAPRDPAALASALERLLVDPQLAARLGSAGLAHAAEAGSWDDVAQRFERLYTELLDARAPDKAS